MGAWGLGPALRLGEGRGALKPALNLVGGLIVTTLQERWHEMPRVKFGEWR